MRSFLNTENLKIPQTDSGSDMRIVAIGGGTGLPLCLKALRSLNIDVSAIVSVADDGGSSGRLRQELNMPPPGDIRNCLDALAPASKLKELFSYRFPSNGDIGGHSFGNLAIAALFMQSQEFTTAVRDAGQLLGIHGKVIPAAEEAVIMGAEFEDGDRTLGQVKTIKKRKRISRIFIETDNIECGKAAETALHDADLVIISPGSLYTSVIVTLITGGLFRFIDRSRTKVVYLMNLMTQPGETSGYLASAHVSAIYRHTSEGLIDEVIVSDTRLNEEVRSAYSTYGSEVVEIDEEALAAMDVGFRRRDLAQPGSMIRHDAGKLASVLAELICPLTPT